jgi:hypothetical protein
VYKAYGIISHQPHEYEIDHLISLELGGSNSIRNLPPWTELLDRLLHGSAEQRRAKLQHCIMLMFGETSR